MKPSKRISKRRLVLLKNRRGLNTMENAVLAAVVGGGIMAMWPTMNKAFNNYFKSKSEAIGGGFLQMGEDGHTFKSEQDVVVDSGPGFKNTKVEARNCSDYGADCTL